MITPTTSDASGIVVSTFDHAGGLPAIERIVCETGLAHAYRHSAAGRDNAVGAVQITLAGSGRLWPDGNANGVGIALPRGRCLAFRYGQPVVYTVDPPAFRWEFVYVNLCGAAALAMLGDLTSRHGHALACDPGHPALVRLCDLARGTGIRHRRLALADSARIASDVLLALVEANPGTSGVSGDPLEAACAYLVRHLAEPVDVADAASSVGVSREHLTRLFRRRLGLAPAAWLRRERLHQAELLLRSGTLPLTVVAQRCGFATASHFVYAFRRRFGTTPGCVRAGPRSAQRLPRGSGGGGA